MEHLVVANLFAGRKRHALQVSSCWRYRILQSIGGSLNITHQLSLRQTCVHPQLLRRLYHLQLDAFGRLDSRTISTGNKITMLEEEEEEINEPVAVDPAIQEIPVIDESNDGGKLNSSIFKALRRRQKKAKGSRKPSKTSNYFV